MNITVDKKEDCTASIAVQIPAEKVAEERKEIVKAFSSQANIKGFRKGKAPAKVIEKRFAKDISAELEQRLMNEAISEAVKKDELKVLNVRVPENPTFADDDSYNFEAVATLAPSFELPEYKGIEIEVESEDITDEEMEKSLEDLAQRFAEFNDTDGALEDGQFAVVDFTTNIDGKPVNEVIGKSAGFVDGREGHWVKIEEDSFLPGLAEGIKGLKKDDTKTIEVTINDEFPIEALRGQSVNFDVTVKETKSQEIPEINDEFAAKLLPEKGLDDLKELVKEQLQGEKTRLVADSKVEQVMQKLNEACDFELPEEILEAEAQGNVHSMLQRGAQQGMTEEQLEEQKEEIETSAKEQAETTLRSNFILQEVAAAEGIQATDQEVISRISQMADAAKKPVKAYFKELQKNGRIDHVRNSVLVGKAIDFLVDNAKVTVSEKTETEENA